MSLVKLLIPLTALICELMFIFSSAAFMAQDLIFKTVAPIFIKCNSTLIFSSSCIFKGSFVEQMCNYTYLLLYYSPDTIIYKKLMSTYRMILPLSPTPYLIQRFLLPLLFWPLGKCRNFKKVPICILDRILDFNKYRQVKDKLILSSGYVPVPPKLAVW